MAYVPPIFSALRTSVAADLRDPGFKTFSTIHVGSLINEGIAEMNRVRPLEMIFDVPLAVNSLSYSCPLQQVFLVEGKRTTDPAWWPIEEAGYNGAGTQDGWSLFAGVLTLPGTMVPLDPVKADVRAWGYGDRDKLTLDNDVADFTDMSDEEGVRCYARWTALDLLLHDRMLYQQWQTQSNNSDVSPTQLLQTASGFQQDWTNLRKRLTRLRRVA